MRRQLITAIIVNAFLVLFFIYSNFSIWNMLNEYQLIEGSWSPLSVAYVGKGFVGGAPLATGGLLFSPNYPFWLFFISTAINLYLIIKLQRKKA
jgi:hypothetical protein